VSSSIVEPASAVCKLDIIATNAEVLGDGRDDVDAGPLEFRRLEQRTERLGQRSQREQVMERSRGEQSRQVWRHATRPGGCAQRKPQRRKRDDRRQQLRLPPVERGCARLQSQQMRQHRTKHEHCRSIHVTRVHRIRDVTHQSAQLQPRYDRLHDAGYYQAKRRESEQQRQERTPVGPQETMIGDQPADHRCHQQSKRRAGSTEQRPAATRQHGNGARNRRRAGSQQEAVRSVLSA
jgi:hypothetical protein